MRGKWQFHKGGGGFDFKGLVLCAIPLIIIITEDRVSIIM